MRYRLAIVFLALAVSGCSGGTPAAPASTATSTATSSAESVAATSGPAQQARSVALVEGIERGEFAPVVEAFAPELKGKVTDAQLRDAFAKTAASAGAYERITGSFAQKVQGNDVVYVVAKHAAASLRVLLSYAADQRINGLYFAVATQEDIARATAGTTLGASPGGSATAGGTGVHARDIAVEVGTHALGGTLAVPAGTTARPIAVVLLPGSGPNDRDETIGAAANKPLRDIADGLAARGISSLRFDKRTKAAPASFTKASTVADEYLDDARSAMALLRGRPELTGYRLAVLGHSQGAMVMPNVVRDTGADAGLSLAGSPRSLFDISYDQQVEAIAAAGAPADQQKAQLAQARAWTDAAKAMTDPAAAPPAEVANVMSAPYIVSLNRLNSAQVAQQLTVPLWFGQGEADFQTSLRRDFEAWRPLLAGRDATFRTYPGLNHLFMRTSGVRGVADYDRPGTVDAAMTTDLADWLTAKLS